MGLDAADTAYLHKLRKSRRDKRLISAYLLLLLALRRLRPGATQIEIQTAIAPTVGLLAAGLGAYVARQLQTASPSPARRKAIAVPLLAAIALHTAHAQRLARAERDYRLGLIARAETQRATADLTRRTAGTRTLVRQTTSARPCEVCVALQGTYEYPWPDDVFYTHPNCACEWSVDQR